MKLSNNIDSFTKFVVPWHMRVIATKSPYKISTYETLMALLISNSTNQQLKDYYISSALNNFSTFGFYCFLSIANLIIHDITIDGRFEEILIMSQQYATKLFIFNRNLFNVYFNHFFAIHHLDYNLMQTKIRIKSEDVMDMFILSLNKNIISTFRNYTEKILFGNIYFRLSKPYAYFS